MKVIGLDPSTKTGFCINGGGNEMCWGEKEFPHISGMSRVAAFQQWIRTLLSAHDPELVVIEGYGFANQTSLATLVEIGTVFRLELFHRNIRVVEVAPTSLKKFATGKGVAAKEIVMMNVFKKWDIETRTNNEADAIVLAKIGEALLNPSAPWLLAPQKEVITKLRKGV